MTKTLRIIAALLVATAICGCAGTNQQPRSVITNQVIHREAGIVFPATVGEFPRGAVTLYDDTGQDMSVGYNRTTFMNLIAITVYVYPAPQLWSIGSPPDVVATARKHLTDNHFEEVKGEIVKHHPSAKVISDHESAMSFRGESLYGRTALFKVEEFFAGRIQPIITKAEIYAFGKWIIKFRMTYPAASEAAADASIAAFKKEFIRLSETDTDKATQKTR